VRVSVVHASPSVQVAAQLPSQVSPISTTPFPQTGAQLPSSLLLQPGGQQESPLAQTVIAGYEQRTLHIADVPVRTFDVQDIPSSHVAGQFPSHVSPDSTTPLPHAGRQLLSLFALQPAGQQASPPTHIVIGGCVHRTLHCVGVPESTSFVQASPSLAQVVRQLPSQSSPISTTEFPQTGVQLPSLLALQPGGQQLSPPMHIVTGVNVHWTLHCPFDPVRVSEVQGFPSLQVAGQLPSHVSPVSTTLFPHTGEQSVSLLALQPGAQQRRSDLIHSQQLRPLPRY
jgi:hypothetical protein